MYVKCTWGRTGEGDDSHSDERLGCDLKCVLNLWMVLQGIPRRQGWWINLAYNNLRASTLRFSTIKFVRKYTQKHERALKHTQTLLYVRACEHTQATHSLLPPIFLENKN